MMPLPLRPTLTSPPAGTTTTASATLFVMLVASTITAPRCASTPRWFPSSAPVARCVVATFVADSTRRPAPPTFVTCTARSVASHGPLTCTPFARRCGGLPYSPSMTTVSTVMPPAAHVVATASAVVAASLA